eukprot:2292846-Rhodomonas_salina.1
MTETETETWTDSERDRAKAESGPRTRGEKTKKQNSPPPEKKGGGKQDTAGAGERLVDDELEFGHVHVHVVDGDARALRQHLRSTNAG